MNINVLRLLVVEDDIFQRQLILKLLRSLGITEVIEAADGSKALEILQDTDSKPVDVMITDLNFSGMDGLELIRHISEASQQPEVIIVSGLDKKLLASAARMTEIYGVQLLGTLEKPVTLIQLKELLGKHKQTLKKLQAPDAARTFTIEEVLAGLRANQFEPYFQPKVDLKTGRLVGAETLARWIHPEAGVIAPYAFIKLLEKHGHMDELTYLMLKKSAEACRDLHKGGYTFTISVNLSLKSLNEVSLADKIIKMVRDAGVDPHYIVLEISEATAMTDSGHALENLIRMSMNGLMLSIDDYGTGYTSIQQLTRIAFGELKIDQSFIKNFAQNEAMHMAVESSIEMASKLEVKSVAQGVETQQDWDLLQSMGCDTAQGYFIAAPMSLSDFTEYIKNYKVPAQTENAMALKEKRILVIEDDKFVRAIIVRILGELNSTQVIDVDNAMDARIMMGKQVFDLIITDVDMPGMNGLELVQLIRTGKTHAKADTRVLVLTGHSNAQLMSVALALDVNGFLIKPVVPAVLYEKMEKAAKEKLHLRSPLAYQSVMTRLQNLPHSEIIKAPVLKPEVKIPANIVQITVREVRPNMILRANIHAKDGTLMVSAGRVFNEVSINRLKELIGVLKSEIITVEDPLKNPVVSEPPPNKV